MKSNARRSRKRDIKNTVGYIEYMKNGAINKTFASLPRITKIKIIREGIKNINKKMALSSRRRVRKWMKDDLLHY